MDERIKEKALDFLMDMLDFYHEKLLKVENAGIVGIREAQFRLLLHLYANKTLSMSSLGKLLYISKPYMTSLVDSLTKEELVERHPDLYDRRVINISLTSKGQERIELLRIQLREQMKTVISNLQESDLKTLCSSGEKLIGVVSKIQ
jgi:DNA-binding MarR family transcriptional regulator